MRAPEPEPIAPPLALWALTEAVTTYGKDADLAPATLRQCADEIQVVLQAMFNGCANTLVQTALQGIVQRMLLVAKIVADMEAEAADG